MSHRLRGIAIVFALLMPVAAGAQPAIVLAPTADAEAIRTELTDSLARAQAGSVTPQTIGPPSVGFTIEFEFDSAELTTAGALFLGRIIEVIRSTPQLANARLLVDGHTDAVGTRSYNQSLGQARANTVVAALVQQGIPQQMMFARSFGEDRPLPWYNPSDGRNRRVEITPF